MEMTELHPSIVALIALAANIASNHPKQGLCQMARLKEYGVAKEQIDSVIEIARHIRDESAQLLDAQFEEACAVAMPQPPADPFAHLTVVQTGTCCTPAASGRACC